MFNVTLSLISLEEKPVDDRIFKIPELTEAETNMIEMMSTLGYDVKKIKQ